MWQLKYRHTESQVPGPCSKDKITILTHCRIMWQGHDVPSWHNGLFHCNTSLTHSLSVYTCCDFVRSTQQICLLRRRSFGSSRNSFRKDCVTSQKNVCVGGYQQITSVNVCSECLSSRQIFFRKFQLGLS